MSKVTGSKGCFGAGTLVWTPTGQVAIETLVAGDRVFSFTYGG